MRKGSAWDEFLNCCYGNDREKIEYAIRTAVLCNPSDYGKRFVITGKPGTGKTSVLWNAIAPLKCSTERTNKINLMVGPYEKSHFSDDRINYLETNSEPEEIDDNTILIHTTGMRLDRKTWEIAMLSIQSPLTRENILRKMCTKTSIPTV